jgi:hypothetical protein
MTRTPLSLICAASLALTAPPKAASAQAGPVALKRDLTEWTNLNALAPGETIEVVDRKTSKKHRGTFVGFDDASISLRDDSGKLDLQRQDVRSVKVRGGHLPHAAIWGIGGAAVGAAAGLLAANAASKAYSGTDYYAGLLGGAVIGAILGLLADAGISRIRPSYHVIYRSR